MPHSKTPGGSGASEKFLKQQAESGSSLSSLSIITHTHTLLKPLQSTVKVRPMLAAILTAKHRERHQYVYNSELSTVELCQA